jgi:phospholipid/cholesterol/gamma-HCH transport system substrate-binding protein
VSTERPLPPPPPMRGRHREAWIGLFVIGGVAAILATLFVMTNPAFFRGRYIITTIVPDAAGIRKGDPVLMRGVDIGRVVKFGISQRNVAIQLEIEGEYKIPEDSHVVVRAASLLGGSVADVIPGKSNENVGWGARLPGENGPGLFDRMDTLAGEAGKVAVKMQDLLSGRMVNDVHGSAADARRSLATLQAMLDEERPQIRALVASLRRSAEGVEKVTTSPDLDQTVKRIDAIAGRLEGTANTLDRSSKSVEAIIDRIDRGQGTLGKLTTDDELYRNANDAVANLNKATVELNKLLVDFQAHPRKYINLKIF